MLLLSRPLLAELAHHFLAQARGFGEDVIQSIEHLSESFGADWAPVGHLCRKDYVIGGEP